MVASLSNGQQMEGQSKKEREYGETIIIYLAHQQPANSQLEMIYYYSSDSSDIFTITQNK